MQGISNEIDVTSCSLKMSPVLLNTIVTEHAQVAIECNIGVIGHIEGATEHNIGVTGHIIVHRNVTGHAQVAI